jgi:hypothetical protein
LADSWSPPGFAEGRTRIHLVVAGGGKISYPSPFMQLHAAVGMDLWLAHLGIEASFNFDGSLQRSAPGPENDTFPPDNFAVTGKAGAHVTLPIQRDKFFLLLGGGFVGGGLMINDSELTPTVGAYQSVTFYPSYGMNNKTGAAVISKGSKSGAWGVRVDQKQLYVPSAGFWEHSTTISFVMVPLSAGGRTPYYP